MDIEHAYYLDWQYVWKQKQERMAVPLKRLYADRIYSWEYLHIRPHGYA